MENRDVRIFKLRDNTDIIAECLSDNSIELELNAPYLLETLFDDDERPFMIIKPYLPIVFISENKCNIKCADVIELKPNERILEFYLNTIDKNDDLDDDYQEDYNSLNEEVDEYELNKEVDETILVEELKKNKKLH